MQQIQNVRKDFEQNQKQISDNYNAYHQQVKEEYEKYRKQALEEYAAYVKSIDNVWGKENFADDTQKNWVEYSEDFRSRSIVDFEEGKITVEVAMEEGDVRERGRLKFSADSIDFFSEDGQAGISASNRIKGVVLHDILSAVYCPEDLETAVLDAVRSGDITEREASEALTLLRERLSQVSDRGWFPEDRESVLNETSIIDTDGKVYRPDRVIRNGGSVIIVDYKFGEHYPKYERQMLLYADMWRRMGVEEVSAFLWYVQTGDIMRVV